MSKDKKDKNEKRIASGTFREKPGAAPGVAVPVQAQQAAAVPAGGKETYISSLILDKSRAGRAPYNFVPQATEVRSFDPAPVQDRYVDHLVSGEIEYEIRALTNFYIRGMWGLKDFVEGQKETKGQIDPFNLQGWLRLPGSSLRGMLRTLVEILGAGPLEVADNKPMFFRTIGSTDQPINHKTGKPNTSYEPQAKIYKKLMMANPAPGNIKIGLLHKRSKTDWFIRPLRTQTYYRVHDQMTLLSVPGEYGRERICFEKPANDTDIVRKICLPDGKITLKNPQQGWLICSGPLNKERDPKNKQWIVHDDEDTSKEIKILPEDLDIYQEAGESYWLESGAEGSRLSFISVPLNDPQPCFYTEHSGHVWFGHTRFFRLPYHNTARTINSLSSVLKEGEHDLAEVMFGSLRVGKSRINVEDALSIKSGGFKQGEPVATVLGTPKLTTYQHYLVQDSDKQEKAICWDSNNAECFKPPQKVRLRGHKLYWHRPGAEPLPADESNRNMRVEFRPGHSGLVFRGRIRYDNLRPIELGALLTALELPFENSGHYCAHHLGMGKPHGMGSFHITVPDNSVHIIDRRSRYQSLFANDRSFTTGAREATAQQRESWKIKFAGWYLQQKGVEWNSADAFSEEQLRAYRPLLQQFWLEPRLAELRAILTWDENMMREPGWTENTRYLKIGDTDRGGRNEYVKPSPRRPLPPASQVLKWGGESR